MATSFGHEHAVGSVMLRRGRAERCLRKALRRHLTIRRSTSPTATDRQTLTTLLDRYATKISTIGVPRRQHTTWSPKAPRGAATLRQRQILCEGKGQTGESAL